MKQSTNRYNYANDVALTYLERMLDGKHYEAIYEWIKIVAESGQIVPTEFVKPLLSIGDEINTMRPYILQITGQTYDPERIWVSTITKFLPEYLYDLHVEECENDAFMIGALTYGVWLTEYLSNRRGMWDTQFMYPYYELHNLYKYSVSWSKPLTKTFAWALYKVFHLKIHSIEFAYRLSPAIRYEGFRHWLNKQLDEIEHEATRDILHESLGVFEYRQQMLKAILEG